MCAQTARLSDRQLKTVKPKDKDYVLTDGDGLQLRVRVNRSMQWNFNYRHPVTKNRINMALGSYPEVSLAQARRKAVEAREVLAQALLHPDTHAGKTYRLGYDAKSYDE
ncbi:MAG: integrase arm-type DNA-binding domain-containing protein, partial [Pseudomonas putida]